MPKTERLVELIALLAGRRSWTVRELAERFATTERTIFRDLVALETIGFPWSRDDRGYRLTAGAALRPLLLDAGERAMLRLILTNPALRRPKALARRLDALAAKLDALSPAENPSLVLASLDRSGPVQAGVFEAIERAIERASLLEIDYASLRSGKRSWRGVDPWVIFHRADAWYLAGRCHRSDEARLFRLDRIAGVRDLGGNFVRPPEFDVERFLESAWSLHHGEPRHEVSIRFEASLAPLIANARHHAGERIERLADGALEYRVKLADLEEIARWVAGFGGRAVALEPREFVDRVRALAEGVAAAHPEVPKLRAAAKVAARPRTRARDRRSSAGGK